MDIKLVLVLSVLAIITSAEAAKAKRKQPVAKIGEACFNKRCPKGTSCRSVRGFQLMLALRNQNFVTQHISIFHALQGACNCNDVNGIIMNAVLIPEKNRMECRRAGRQKCESSKQCYPDNTCYEMASPGKICQCKEDDACWSKKKDIKILD